MKLYEVFGEIILKDDNVNKKLDQAEKQGKQTDKEFRGLEKTFEAVGKSMTSVGDKSLAMAKKMKSAYYEQKQKLREFKIEQMAVEYGFFELSQSTDQYKGKTTEFINEIEKLGKTQKTVTDNMIKNNGLMKTSFFESIGAMLVRSTQSEKISQNLERMGNPLTNVNQGLLKITNGLENMAKRGQAAHLALKMLGPTANMKELLDMTRMINAGLLRFQMVAAAALIAGVLFYAGLHDAAMDSVPGYQEAFETMASTMREAFQPMVEVFGAIMKRVYEFITAIGEMMIKFNEAHPVLAKILQGILLLIPALTLLLSPLAIGIGLFNGMAAAFASVWALIGPLVVGLGSMMGTVLLVAAAVAVVVAAFVQMWKHSENLRTSVVNAWNAIKSGVMSALSPLLPLWEQLKTAFTNMISTFVGGEGTWSSIWKRLGDAMAVVIDWAVNIGLPIFVNYIKGLAQVVGIAISALILVFNLISDWWKTNGPIISTAVKTAFDIIKAAIEESIKIWGDIKEAAETALKAIFETAQTTWTTLSEIAQTVWEAIKDFISDPIGVARDTLSTIWTSIKGTAETKFGEFKTMASAKWGEIKTAVETKVDDIKKSVATKIDNFKKDVSAKWGQFKTEATNKWQDIKTAVGNKVDEIKTTIGTKIDGIKTTVSTKFGQVKTAMTTPVDEAKRAIETAVKAIKGFFDNMKLKIPKIQLPKLPKFSISGSFSLKPPSVPKIGVDWYAKGGVFSGPSVIGVGEEPGVSEAVLPLKDQVLGKIADMISANMPSSSAGNQPIILNAIIEMDGYEVTRQQMKFINTFQGDSVRGKSYVKGVK